MAATPINAIDEPATIRHGRFVRSLLYMAMPRRVVSSGVMLIKMPKNPIELQEIITALLTEQTDGKHMYSFKSGHLVFECLEEIPWTLDGEYGGSHEEVTVKNNRQVLQIMVRPEIVASISKAPAQAEEKNDEKM